MTTAQAFKPVETLLDVPSEKVQLFTIAVEGHVTLEQAGLARQDLRPMSLEPELQHVLYLSEALSCLLLALSGLSLPLSALMLRLRL